MANVIEVIIKGEDKASAVLSRVGGSLSGLGSTAAGVATGGLALAAAAVVGLGVAAVATSVGIYKLTMAAADVEGTRQTFVKLGGDIDSLKEATRGMVAEADLMAASNKFLTMGITETSEETAKMAEMATQLGLAMGTDATKSMEDFALMMANQSIPRLDTFGISSAKVRKRMEELMKATEASGISQADWDSGIARSTNRIEELQGKLHLAGIKQSEWTDKTKESTKVAHAQRIDKITRQIAEEEVKLSELADTTVGFTEASEAMTREEAFKIAALEEGAIAMGKVGEQGESATATTLKWKTAIADLGLGIGQAFIPALEAIRVPALALVEKYGPLVIEWAGKAGKAFERFAGELVAAAEEGWPAVLELLAKWGREFWDWTTMVVIPWTKEKIGEVVTAITAQIKEQGPVIKKTLVGWGEMFWDWTTEVAAPAAKPALDDLAFRVINWAESEETQEKFHTAGMAAGKGLAKGLQGFWRFLTAEWWREGLDPQRPDMKQSFIDLGKEAVTGFIEGLLAGFDLGLSPAAKKIVKMFATLLFDGGTGIPVVIKELSTMIEEGLTDAGVGMDRHYTRMEGRTQRHTLLSLGYWRNMSDELVGNSIIPNMLDRMATLVVGRYHSMLGAGRHIMSGLTMGILRGAGAVKDAIIRAVNDAISSAMAHLGIHSSSTVFEGLGRMSMEGFAKGLSGAGGGLALGDLVLAGVGGGGGDTRTVSNSLTMNVQTRATAGQVVMGFETMRALV